MRAQYVHLQVWAKNLFVFFQWILYGGIVGVVVGSVASLFYFCISIAKIIGKVNASLFVFVNY